MKRRPRRSKAARSRSLLLRDRAPEPDTQPMRSYDAWQPAPVAPAPARRTHQGTYGEWTGTMTTNEKPAKYTNERVLAARIWLNLKVAYLEREGLGYRIAENERLMQRGEKPEDRIMADTLREGIAHLMGPRQ